MYFLKTKRLGFRPWSVDDTDLAVRLWSDSAVMRFIGGALGRDKAEERLLAEIEHAEALGVQYWPIFLLANGAHAGCCGLAPRKVADGIYELGFHVRRMLWGKGLATEAARGVIEHAFRTLGAAELFAGHHPANRASQHILEKLGFVYTHDEPYGPTATDHRCYVLKPDGGPTADASGAAAASDAPAD